MRLTRAAAAAAPALDPLPVPAAARAEESLLTENNLPAGW